MVNRGLGNITLSRRNFLRLAGITAVSASIPLQFVPLTKAQASALAAVPPDIHVLNRLTFGARPADIGRIRQLGISEWIEWQLQPEAIDDPISERLRTDAPVLFMNFNDATRFQVQNDYQVGYILAWTRMARAVYSERQLFERVVEFWTDHFNIPMDDFAVEKLIDDREVVRKHAFGHFRDMLIASAQSRAMLQYLNNDSSTKEHPNENYAREVMELHTLGVDGGYTEQDVKELARILTGWTVRETRDGFYFDADSHDTGEKTFLGRTFVAGRGIEEGLEALDMLARHSNTALFIATKLCRRFVSDFPPDSIVSSTAKVFTETDGDIKAVLRHIFTSSEFMESAGQKLRRPIDFFAALVRVSGLEIKNPDILLWMLRSMGQLPFGWHPPNGYPDFAAAWMNTNGMLGRWNAALLLPVAATGWLENHAFDVNRLVGEVGMASELVDSAAAAVLPGVALADVDRTALIQFVTDSDADQPINAELRANKLATLIGLLIASPYFQWI